MMDNVSTMGVRRTNANINAPVNMYPVNKYHQYAPAPVRFGGRICNDERRGYQNSACYKGFSIPKAQRLDDGS